MKKETKEGIIAFFIIMIIGAAIYAYVRPEIPKSERLIYLFIILLPTLYVARGYYLIFSDKLSSFMRMFGFTLIFIGVIFLCTFIDIKINLIMIVSLVVILIGIILIIISKKIFRKR